MAIVYLTKQAMIRMADERDRPVIEVTPAMVEVGVACMYASFGDAVETNKPDFVAAFLTDVYRQMTMVAS